jgi:diacylglycerol kinase
MTPLKTLTEHVRGTLAIHPDRASYQVSPGRWASFGYALAGLLHVLRYAKNSRIQALATIIVIAIGLWAGLDRLEWALILLTIGLNWLVEVINSAIEAVVNLASPGYHPMARVAKDVAAGGSLLAALLSLGMAGLVLLPAVLERLE